VTDVDLLVAGGGPVGLAVAIGARAARLPGGRIAGIIRGPVAFAAGDLVPGRDGFLVAGFVGCRGIGGRRLGRDRLRRIGRGFVALEEGVLLDLALDIGVELDIRELQQLDRLLQLRRHDQRLALPDIEPLNECHDKCGRCCSQTKGACTANFVPTPLFSVKHVMTHFETNRKVRGISKR